MLFAIALEALGPSEALEISLELLDHLFYEEYLVRVSLPGRRSETAWQPREPPECSRGGQQQPALKLGSHASGSRAAGDPAGAENMRGSITCRVLSCPLGACATSGDAGLQIGCMCINYCSYTLMVPSSDC